MSNESLQTIKLPLVYFLQGFVFVVMTGVSLYIGNALGPLEETVSRMEKVHSEKAKVLDDVNTRIRIHEATQQSMEDRMESHHHAIEKDIESYEENVKLYNTNPEQAEKLGFTYESLMAERQKINDDIADLQDRATILDTRQEQLLSLIHI